MLYLNCPCGATYLKEHAPHNCTYDYCHRDLTNLQPEIYPSGKWIEQILDLESNIC